MNTPFVYYLLIALTTTIRLQPASCGVHESASYCAWDDECTCIDDGERYNINCDGAVDIISRNEIDISFGGSIGRHNKVYVSMVCLQANLTTEVYGRLTHLKMDMDQSISYRVTNCLPPEGSYSSLFQNQSKIEDLYIDLNRDSYFEIKSIHFAGLSELRSLTVRRLGMVEFPGEMFGGLSNNASTMSIVDSIVESIDEDTFRHTPALDEINLSNNKLRRIGHRTFQGQSSLRRLNLAQNRLKRLENGLLESSVLLSSLNISNNGIEVFPETIRSLSNLLILDFSFNGLRKVSNEDFDQLELLEGIYLRGNRLRSLDSMLFARMTRLRVVDLASNMIGNWRNVSSINDSLGVEFKSDLRNVTVDYGLELDPTPNNTEPSIPEGLFRKNEALEVIKLDHNSLSVLPETIFDSCTELREFYASSNLIRRIPDGILSNCTNLNVLDVSENTIEQLPTDFVSRLSHLTHLNVSNNRIVHLPNGSLPESKHFETLDISHNELKLLPMDIFLPLNQRRGLKFLNMEGNMIASLPTLALPGVNILNLANNKLTTLTKMTFHSMASLKGLNLSYNDLNLIEMDLIFTKEQPVEWIDLSHNRLAYLNGKWFPYMDSGEPYPLKFLNMSHNLIEYYEFDYRSRGLETPMLVEHLDMSNNVLKHFSFFHWNSVWQTTEVQNVKHLDLSGNHLQLKDTIWRLDYVRRTWGKMSVFQSFISVEVLNLSRNHIEVFPVDLRHRLPKLKILDLSQNMISRLQFQDLLFSRGTVDQLSMEPESFLWLLKGMDWSYRNYTASHHLTVDLRNNNIRELELPDSEVETVPNRCDKHLLFSHATILLAGNPMACGCEIFQILRYAAMEIRPVALLEKKTGRRLVLPAKINVDGLQCWDPVSVRGKYLSDPEMWMHHLLPLYGICHLTNFTRN